MGIKEKANRRRRQKQALEIEARSITLSHTCLNCFGDGPSLSTWEPQTHFKTPAPITSKPGIAQAFKKREKEKRKSKAKKQKRRKQKKREERSKKKRSKNKRQLQKKEKQAVQSHPLPCLGDEQNSLLGTQTLRSL